MWEFKKISETSYDDEIKAIGRILRLWNFEKIV